MKTGMKITLKRSASHEVIQKVGQGKGGIVGVGGGIRTNLVCDAPFPQKTQNPAEHNARHDDSGGACDLPFYTSSWGNSRSRHKPSLVLDLKTRRWAQTSVRIALIPGAIAVPLDEVIELGMCFTLSHQAKLSLGQSGEECVQEIFSFAHDVTLPLCHKTFFHIKPLPDFQRFCLM